MKTNSGNLLKSIVLTCAILLSISASAQPFIRYVVPSDIGTKSLYSDAVLSSIPLPRGVARVDNNPVMQDAAFELMDILRDRDSKLLCVYVCGSASPDGLWQENVNLSAARTRNAANYLRHVTGIPAEMIHQESLNEDWDRLYELVEASDMRSKEQVLWVIRNLDWGARKTALQSLDNGRVWKVLMDDFFPQLRCVRISFFRLWEPTKPYMGSTKPEPVTEKPDTVYVKDTVYYIKETIYVPQETVQPEVAQQEKPRKEKKVRQPKNKGPYYDSPWMMGFKTNLISDVMMIPDLGFEVQIGRKMSFNLNGWYAAANVLTPGAYANFSGFSPEFRWWFGNRTMQKGHFLGLHANMAWYTLEWQKRDGSFVLYQNGTEGDYSNPDVGLSCPAWSAGLTYGYSLGFGRKANWGLEFVLGLGYIRNEQNLGTWNDIPEPGWYFAGHESNTYFGVTKLGINLTYRFSLRKVTPDYYDQFPRRRDKKVRD